MHENAVSRKVCHHSSTHNIKNCTVNATTVNGPSSSNTSLGITFVQYPKSFVLSTSTESRLALEFSSLDANEPRAKRAEN